jgi:hypothetical protein
MFICGKEPVSMASGSAGGKSVGTTPSEEGRKEVVGLAMFDELVHCSRPFQFLCGAALARARKV